MRHPHARSGTRRQLSAVLLFALSACCLALPVQAADAVGEVSLVLGKAWLQSADSTRQPIGRGTAVRVSDQIHTEANGHVHIRFVDEALVSVRPHSRLEITAYDYRPAQPGQSTVKFNLVEGVTRSISGDAGQSSRDRFRLDTPIAAIGVRGTDFVVSASQQNVRALVNEGAIVVAPYSADCLSSGLGPCEAGGVELAGNGMQILELAYGQPQAVLRPRQEQEVYELLDEESERALAEAEDGGAAVNEAVAEVYQETVTARRVEERVRSSMPPEDSTPSLPDFTPAAAVASSELRERQLTWGRFSGGQAELELITVAYADARADRQVTVGDGVYGLFRSESGDNPRVNAGLGVVGFELEMAQAFHHGAAGTEVMRVDGGELRIDFNSNRFDTQLRLDAEATGLLNYSASGSINNQGYFNSRGPSGAMAGAVSQDGREAGYFFEQQLDSGLIQGLTLWGQSQ